MGRTVVVLPSGLLGDPLELVTLGTDLCVEDISAPGPAIQRWCRRDGMEDPIGVDPSDGGPGVDRRNGGSKRKAGSPSKPTRVSITTASVPVLSTKSIASGSESFGDPDWWLIRTRTQ